MFRKLISALAFSLYAATAIAGQTAIDTSGLSDAQVAELKVMAAKAVAEQARGNAGVDAKDVGTGLTLAATWGQQAATAAEGFARAMGIAARELNVTINDFLKSDAGKLTAVIIIWKVAGAAAMKALYGILFVTVGLSMVKVVYTRLFTKEFVPVTYSRFFGAFKGTKMVRVPKSFADFSSDGEWLAFWVMIAMTVLVLGLGGTFF